MALQYESFHVGALVRLKATFTNATLPIDPAAVSIFVADPAGDVTEYTYGGEGTIVKESPGVYYLDFSIPDQPGIWYWRAQSTGTGQAAKERRFDVIQPHARPQEES